MRQLAIALCGLLLLPASSATAAGDAKGKPAVDVAAMTCRDATALADADGAAFTALAQWLDGWLKGRANDTGYDPTAIAARATAWTTACRAAPDRPLAAVADTAVADATPVTASGGDGFDMAFLKCFQFIDLETDDRTRAVAAVRWIDGWHAGSLGESVVDTAHHLYMTEAALQGCMKRSYHRKNLITVLAGKHR